MAPCSLYCVEVPLRNCSLTHSPQGNHITSCGIHAITLWSTLVERIQFQLCLLVPAWHSVYHQAFYNCSEFGRSKKFFSMRLLQGLQNLYDRHSKFRTTFNCGKASILRKIAHICTYIFTNFQWWHPGTPYGCVLSVCVIKDRWWWW